MEFKEIVKSRYSVKKFDGKKISEDKIKELIELVSLAPSSYNIQPWKINIISDQKTKDEISQVSWNQPQISSSSHILVFSADTNLLGLIDQIEHHLPKSESTSAYIKMMKDFVNGMSDQDKKHWAQRQVYIAMSHAILAARSLGFHSSPMEGFSPDGVAKLLNLPNHIVPTVLCAIGYPSDTPRDKFRFPVDKIIVK